MDLHNGLDIEVYDLCPTDLHYYYYVGNSTAKIEYFPSGTQFRDFSLPSKSSHW